MILIDNSKCTALLGTWPSMWAPNHEEAQSSPMMDLRALLYVVDKVFKRAERARQSKDPDPLADEAGWTNTGWWKWVTTILGKMTTNQYQSCFVWSIFLRKPYSICRNQTVGWSNYIRTPLQYIAIPFRLLLPRSESHCVHTLGDGSRWNTPNDELLFQRSLSCNSFRKLVAWFFKTSHVVKRHCDTVAARCCMQCNVRRSTVRWGFTGHTLPLSSRVEQSPCVYSST